MRMLSIGQKACLFFYIYLNIIAKKKAFRKYKGKIFRREGEILKKIWIFVLCVLVCITGILIADRAAAAIDGRMAGSAFVMNEKEPGLYALTLLGDHYSLDCRFALPVIEFYQNSYLTAGKMVIWMNQPIVDATKAAEPFLKHQKARIINQFYQTINP